MSTGIFMKIVPASKNNFALIIGLIVFLLFVDQNS